MIHSLSKSILFAGILGLTLAGVAHADIAGFGNFTTNGSAVVSGPTLNLTQPVNGQNGTGFDLTPQPYNQGFSASFTFSATNPNGGGADGFTFMLQNDPRGTTALGGGGGAKGYSDGGVLFPPITPSVAIVGNNFNGSALGTGVNGAQNPLEDTVPSGVDLRTGPVDFTVLYNPASVGSEVSLVATQGVGNFTRNYATGDLTAILGGTTAFVGFSAGTGGANYQQDITNFSYNAVPEPTTIMALVGATGMLLGLRRRRA